MIHNADEVPDEVKQEFLDLYWKHGLKFRQARERCKISESAASKIFWDHWENWLKQRRRKEI